MVADPLDLFTMEKLTRADLPVVRSQAWASPAAMRDFRAKTEELAEAVAAIADPAEAREESFRLGCAYWVLARYSDAVAAFEEVRMRREALWLMGQCYMALGRPAQALEAFEKVSKGDDVDVELALQLAAALRESGDVEAAKKMLHRFEAEGEALADYHYEVAQCLEVEGDPVQAVEVYERAIELDPQCAKAAFRLGHIHDLYGDDDRALEYYQQCVAIEPCHVNALISLGVFHEDTREDQKALRCFERVLKAIPTQPRAQLYYRDIRSYETQYYDESLEKTAGRRQAVLDTPVTDFELSVRSRNCLERMNIRLLGDLAQITEQELLSYKNFGETSLNEIKAILAQHALRLGQAIEDGGAVAEEPDETGGTDALSQPVADLALSARCTRCLDRLNVVTVADLANLTRRELLDCPNLGKTSLDEIVEKLGELGLPLRAEDE